MYIRLNEDLEDKVVEITGTDYRGTLDLEDIENIIKDLIVEYDRKVEELEEKEEYCNEYHTSTFNPYEEYDVNERDFH